jgi:ketosteroid isomerase-like protein
VDLAAEVARLATQVRELRDREAIRETLVAYAIAMDTRAWEDLRVVFAPEIVFIPRPGVTWRGADEVVASLESREKHFVSSHMLTNVRIALDGDSARAVAYLHSVDLEDPARRERHTSHGAWYLVELRRTEDGWRIARLKHTWLWLPAGKGVEAPITDAELAEMREFR